MTRRHHFQSWLYAGILLCLLVGAGCVGTQCEPLPPVSARTETVSVLLRKEYNTDPHRPRYCRHIHMLMPDGGMVDYNSKLKPNFFRYIFLRNEGVVRRTPWLLVNRRAYTDADYAQDAKHNGKTDLHLVTIWAEIPVTPDQVRRLEAAWARMEADPPVFRLLRQNCATRAAQNMIEAGILCRPIGGVGRPETILKDLKARYGSTLRIRTGYFGKAPDGGWMILPLPPKRQSPAAHTSACTPTHAAH